MMELSAVSYFHFNKGVANATKEIKCERNPSRAVGGTCRGVSPAKKTGVDEEEKEGIGAEEKDRDESGPKKVLSRILGSRSRPLVDRQAVFLCRALSS